MYCLNRLSLYIPAVIVREAGYLNSLYMKNNFTQNAFVLYVYIWFTLIEFRNVWALF